MEIPVRNLQGETVGQLILDSHLWDGPVNRAILSQAVAMYRNNLRRWTASTKTRAEVSGGGKKPWKQKHTGRARAGSIRSPLWRGGGIIFGPHPRRTYYQLPQAIRVKALLESLKGKLRDQELVVVDQLIAQAPKTKPFARLAEVFKARQRSVIVLHRPTDALIKSLRNLETFALCNADNLNAFDVLNAHTVLLTKGAFEQIHTRLTTDYGASNNDATRP